MSTYFSSRFLDGHHSSPISPRGNMTVSLSATTTRNYGGTMLLSSGNVYQNPSHQNLSFPLNLNPKPITISGSNHTRPNRICAISSSAGTESNVVNEETVNVLDNVKVFGLDGQGIPISDLWKDRRAVVAFARHFGCVFCRKRADILASVKDKMDAAGVALVLIGPGSVDQAKTFYAQTKFKGEVYADPSYDSYKAFRFVSGVLTTFTPGAGLKIIELYMEGYRQDWELSFVKDTRERGGWQQGGVVIAGPGKTNFLYIHKDKEAGDDPPIEDILRACCSP